VSRVAALAMKRGKSVDFTGYWQLAPFALSAAPFTCSRSIIVFVCYLGKRDNENSCAVVPRICNR
jgi:hypothetical protein